MIENNIFVYKLFLSLNISDFNFCKIATPWKKLPPSFPATPLSKLRSYEAPPFWKLGRGFNPPKTLVGGLIHYGSGVTPSKVYYSNTRHQSCVNWTLLSLRPILHLRKIPSIAKNWCDSSHYAPNEILLIHQILNSSEPKVSAARRQFYIKSPSFALRPLLHFRKK